MDDTSPIKVLLADDDKDDCFLFKEALEEVSLATQLKVVNNGEQLMHYLTKEAVEFPNVLFLDLNMPRKNGFACLEEIKSSENLMHIPVIIFSTSYDENIADRLFKKGAQHYICKPAEFSQLIKIIECSLKLILKEKTSSPLKENFLLSTLKLTT
ncbi:response regulator [Solitalea sp. MAHUQ-68]|uniref:Response regulator n=1 Tax=Solitalea agri TaxID=2953739 RepID=A0A9X2JGQ0_9SPHI|nr:response regulator [Solitalea agri]MCO4294656.1 response regulator [Solitalea agri]